MHFGIGEHLLNFWFQSFQPPTAPALLQILSGAQAAQDLLPSGSYYSLPPNKVIEISIPVSVYDYPETKDLTLDRGVLTVVFL